LNSIHISSNIVSKFYSQTEYNLDFIITWCNTCKVICFIYTSLFTKNTDSSEQHTVRTETSIADETTSFLQLIKLCKKRHYTLTKVIASFGFSDFFYNRLHTQGEPSVFVRFF